MSNEYKQCPNGHYYQGDHCPFCKSVGNDQGSITTQKTEIFNSPDGGPLRPTENFNIPENAPTSNSPYATPRPAAQANGGGKTTVIDNQQANYNPSGYNSQSYTPPFNAYGNGGASMSGRTVFGDDDDTPYGTPMQANASAFREMRKFVGWLVSYSLDPMGVDFKLYEGRNIIGRDQDCSVTVNDNWVSSKHAVLLFRAGKYSITDSQSSHGTFVNDRDIELEPCYLCDGDLIRIGHTVFKFRSSL
ncbi:MAG: FHA domain-containing protein [Bacteroidales bacterium]|nr:FHA domain-containing protein [Bacteroidales bacterium]